MARIAGVELPHHKRMEIALTYIYGIGRSAAQRRFSPRRRSIRPATATIWGADEQVRIRNIIDEKFKVEGDLRREVRQINQTPDGSRMLPRHTPSPRSAGARPAYAYQRAYAKGPAQGRRGQEAVAFQGLERRFGRGTGTVDWKLAELIGLE